MKKTPLKKKSKTDQQKKESLRKKCVAKAKEISKRNNPFCEYCGTDTRVLHSHHIFSEGLNKGMSADVDNLITLCWLHHLGGLKFVSTKIFSFHGSPADATAWLIENRPKKYKELLKRSRIVEPKTLKFWEEKLEELKNYE